jgi:hypothetical protein
MIKGRKQQRFSKDEDKKLKELVEKYGISQWPEIANFFPFRTLRQCRDRWIYYLDPSFSKRVWSNQEDDILEKAVLKEGKKWHKISSKYFRDRSEVDVRNRFVSLTNKKRNCSDQNAEKQVEESVQEEENSKEIFDERLEIDIHLDNSTFW